MFDLINGLPIDPFAVRGVVALLDPVGDSGAQAAGGDKVSGR